MLRERGHARLAVLVPFAAQEGPAEGKWIAEGFGPCRVRALNEKPPGKSMGEWVASWAVGADADADVHAEAVVFDYVGFPSDILDEVAAGTGLPVIDLGHLALDLLAETLRDS